MKKLSLFLSIFLVALSFNSCTSDDDNDTPDKIIGKWRLSQIFVQIDQDVIDDDMLTECDKKSTIEFFENGTYKENNFFFEETTNTCEALGTVNGTWKNLGNSLYEISEYDISDIDIPGLTVSLQLKITFESNKMIMEFSGTGNIEGEEIEFLVKVTYIDNDTYVPDSIIGKWRLDQEFSDDVEVDLTDCAKTMTIEFFEAGTYEEKDFEENEALQCVALEVKNGTWRNSGGDMYEISDLGVPEFKVTFANNKMTVEYADTEEGVMVDKKLIFIKVIS